MESPVKHRLGLYLRSEKAMGLTSLPLLMRPAAAMPSRPVEAPPVPRPVPVAQPKLIAAPPPATKPVAAPSTPKPIIPILSGSALFQGDTDAPFSSALLPREEKIAALSNLDEASVRPCQKCGLRLTCRQTVFGEGDPDASLFFIGEGPGEQEDKTGRPFVGPAGQKLDEMIAAMGLQRSDVFIANIVKCRPPGNRVPMQDEVDACTPYLLKQLEIVRPKVIVTLGLPASRYMLKSKDSMGRMRGHWHTWRGIKLMPTFHPSYILRNYTKETRAAVWSDLQMVMKELGLSIKKKSEGQ